MQRKLVLLAAALIAAAVIVLLTPSAPSPRAREAVPERSAVRPSRAVLPRRPSPIATAPRADRYVAAAARGITPRRLYGSRAGGRMTYLGIAARELGEPALADAAEALGRRMWQLTEPDHAEAELDALLVEQGALVTRFQDLARNHPDDPALIVLVGQVHEDLVAAASGAPRSIDHKLETEDDEGPRHNEIDDDDDKIPEQTP